MGRQAADIAAHHAVEANDLDTMLESHPYDRSPLDGTCHSGGLRLRAARLIGKPGGSELVSGQMTLTTVKMALARCFMPHVRASRYGSILTLTSPRYLVNAPPDWSESVPDHSAATR